MFTIVEPTEEKEAVRLSVCLSLSAPVSIAGRKGTSMSDSNSVSGKVSLLEDTKEYGQNGFRKRLLVIAQENGRYENIIPMYFIQDNCEMADGLEEGMLVTVSFRLRGRAWQRDAEDETKYFLDAEVLDIFSPLDNEPEEVPPPHDDDEVPF